MTIRRVSILAIFDQMPAATKTGQSDAQESILDTHVPMHLYQGNWSDLWSLHLFNIWTHVQTPILSSQCFIYTSLTAAASLQGIFPLGVHKQ